MSSQINSEQNSKCKVKMELYIPTYLSIPQLNNYFSPILVYVRDQFYKTILWLVSSSSHTTLHTVHLSISYFSLFIIILLYIRTASKSSSILQNYPLTYLLFYPILLYIWHFFRSLISLSSSPYYSTHAPLPNLIDLYSHCSTTSCSTTRSSYILLIFTEKMYTISIYIHYFLHTYYMLRIIINNLSLYWKSIL